MKAVGNAPTDRRLIRYVALGFLASVAFVVFDVTQIYAKCGVESRAGFFRRVYSG